jgi:hypothetical protein
MFSIDRDQWPSQSTCDASVVFWKVEADEEYNRGRPYSTTQEWQRLTRSLKTLWYLLFCFPARAYAYRS